MPTAVRTVHSRSSRWGLVLLFVVVRAACGSRLSGTCELCNDEGALDFNGQRIVFQREGDRLASGPLMLTQQDE